MTDFNKNSKTGLVFSSLFYFTRLSLEVTPHWMDEIINNIINFNVNSTEIVTFDKKIKISSDTFLSSRPFSL